MIGPPDFKGPAKAFRETQRRFESARPRFTGIYPNRGREIFPGESPERSLGQRLLTRNQGAESVNLFQKDRHRSGAARFNAESKQVRAQKTVRHVANIAFRRQERRLPNPESAFLVGV